MAKDNAYPNETGPERQSSSSSRQAWEVDTAVLEQQVRSSIEDQLAQAKASRNQAESARQKIANEILDATKEVCQKLIADGEQTLQRAKKLEADAQQKHEEAQAELEKGRSSRSDAQAYAERVKSEAQKKAQEKLDQAQAIKAEADAYRDKVMAEVQQQAQEQLDHAQNIRHEADTYRERVIGEAKEQGQEILYLARSSAEQECEEMKRQASMEAQRTTAEAELIKAAAQEELEAQRIYAEAARLETESLEVLAQVRAKLTEQGAAEESDGQWLKAAVQSAGHDLGSWKSDDYSDDDQLQRSEPAGEPDSESQPDPGAVQEPANEAPAKGSRNRKRQSSSEKD